MRRNLIASIGALMLATCGAASAGVILDNMDTAANFTGWTTSGSPSTATANLDGTVTLTRQTGGVDAGVDWFENTSGHIPLTRLNDILEIYPQNDAANDYYSTSILFFNGPTFASEVLVQADRFGNDPPLIVPSVSALAPVGADNYFVRFRINPIGDVGASVRFDQINAVPEPAGVCAVGMMVAALVARRRRAMR